MEEKRLKCRLWLEIDGKRFFGPGRDQLLKGIEELGSLSSAAKQMGMSYKKAWDMIQDLNSRGPQPFVTFHKGGAKGGSAELTEFGRRFLSRYEVIVSEMSAYKATWENKLISMWSE
ncbi:winged helix-turn-helix domain-containing protein [Lunatimonas salinarum]|uniref:winged helix-turn-helix domain-containing protein n=1 Tax=Lunatimonas salinarum TaxID=1774590 RepID=UPI001AE050C8|nr:winged helix-turn-helix domain-containing protein [Lunatimonas salinarum]